MSDLFVVFFSTILVLAKTSKGPAKSNISTSSNIKIPIFFFFHDF